MLHVNPMYLFNVKMDCDSSPISKEVNVRQCLAMYPAPYLLCRLDAEAYTGFSRITYVTETNCWLFAAYYS